GYGIVRPGVGQDEDRLARVRAPLEHVRDVRPAVGRIASHAPRPIIVVGGVAPLAPPHPGSCHEHPQPRQRRHPPTSLSPRSSTVADPEGARGLEPPLRTRPAAGSPGGAIDAPTGASRGGDARQRSTSRLITTRWISLVPS